jgi:PAS domain S-box-containing protein
MPAGFDEPTVYRSLFVSYPDALLVVDAAGAIVLANPSAAELLGYAPGELTGRNVDSLVPHSIRPRHAALRDGYNRAPRARPMGAQNELVALCKDGSEVRVEIALSPLQVHGTALVVAAIRDVGAFPRVKQALRRARYSEQLAQLGRLAVDSRDPQLVIDRAPVVAAEALQVAIARIFLLDSDPMRLIVASGFGELPGEEVGTRIAHDLRSLPGLVMAQGAPLMVSDFRSEQRFSVPQAYLDAGLTGSLALPLSDRGRVIGVLTVCSRTAQRFGDDELSFLESLGNLVATTLQRAQSEQALKHAQQLESVGQLTGGIAHDFNNLLTVIQGNLQVLGELPLLANDAHGQQLVGAAARASRRGAELTNKLLAFARRQVLQPTAVNVAVLLHSLADMLRRTLDQRIAIEVDVRTPCPPVLADPGQLESALLNIAINARDAMPDGGTLRFTGAACAALPEDLRVDSPLPAAAPSGFVAISVSDTGSGMSDQVKERAFEPFFTTKEVGRGTGLGLSTVYGFVKQSKGSIGIDSAPGAGTTISLYIPQPSNADARGDDDDEGEHELPESLQVLLVEDDGDVAAVMRLYLEALRCRVTQAASAEHALLALDSGERFDLLLTDIALGAGMRGTELAALAVQRLPGLAVLLMSGFSAELLAADRDSPADWELLRKPCTREELARAMSRVVG